MEYYKYELGTLLRGLLSLILLATCADAATLNVPADYATIQARSMPQPPATPYLCRAGPIMKMSM